MDQLGIPGSTADSSLSHPLEEGYRTSAVSIQGQEVCGTNMFVAAGRVQAERRRDCDEMPVSCETAPTLEAVDEEEEDLSSSFPR